jgi:hypothetical protein
MPSFTYPIATPDQIDFETIIEQIFSAGKGGQAGNYSSGGSTFTPAGWGLYGSVSLAGSTFTKALDADGGFNRITSAAPVNSDASLSWGTVTSFLRRRGYNPIGIYKFGLDFTTGERMFVGWANLIASTILGATDPAAASMVGLQFDTSVPDVNFQFVTKDGVAAISRVNTGVPASIGTFFLGIFADDATPAITLELRSATGALLARHVFTANLPASATGLLTINGVRNLGGVARSIRLYYGGGVNRSV